MKAERPDSIIRVGNDLFSGGGARKEIIFIDHLGSKKESKGTHCISFGWETALSWWTSPYPRRIEESTRERRITSHYLSTRTLYITIVCGEQFVSVVVVKGEKKKNSKHRECSMNDSTKGVARRDSRDKRTCCWSFTVAHERAVISSRKNKHTHVRTRAHTRTHTHICTYVCMCIHESLRICRASPFSHLHIRPVSVRWYRDSVNMCV